MGLLLTGNSYITAEELGVQNHICLLPCGRKSESGISKWTAHDLKPYQNYIVEDEAVDTMFSGLIFQPVTGRTRHYLHPMYSNLGLNAQRKDWEVALKRLYLEDYNFDAAAKNTEQGNITDIWVTLPYPNPTQTKFGKVDNKVLNFKMDSDRFAALKWWIDRFLEEWELAEHLHQYLKFRGFVWPRVAIDSGDEELVINVNHYIRSKDLLTLWLQQYGSAGCVEWDKFGFDASCTHPNFYGNKGPDFPWIANSTVFAKYYHLGMQITFGKGLLYKKNHLLDYLNYGVYNDYMNDSLLVFQFPNQTMRDIYLNHPEEYAYLHSFIKKTYTPCYPTAAFPSS